MGTSLGLPNALSLSRTPLKGLILLLRVSLYSDFFSLLHDGNLLAAVVGLSTEPSASTALF